MIKETDMLYRSKHGFFKVWRLSKSLGIYNTSGYKLVSVDLDKVNLQRGLEIAQLCADAIETRFQY